jgi:integrase
MGVTVDNKTGRYVVRLRRRGVEVNRSFQRKGEAEAFHAKTLTDIRAQINEGKKPARSIAEAVEKYLTDEVAHQRAKEKTEGNAMALVPYITGLRLDQLAEAARRVRASTRRSRRIGGKFPEGVKPKPLAAATINRRLAILRRIANLAYNEWHWLDRPIGIRLLPEHNKRHLYLDEDQILALSQMAREPVNHWVIVAAYTGIRRGEALRLGKEAIRGSSLFLGMTKNKKPILLPVPPYVLDAVEKWIDAGRPHERTLHTWFKKGAVAIGVPDLRPHDLRHTCASLILNAGYDLAAVAEVLNCTIANAQRYAHLSTENKKAVLATIAPKHIGVKLAEPDKTKGADSAPSH